MPPNRRAVPQPRPRGPARGARPFVIPTFPNVTGRRQPSSPNGAKTSGAGALARWDGVLLPPTLPTKPPPPTHFLVILSWRRTFKRFVGVVKHDSRTKTWSMYRGCKEVLLVKSMFSNRITPVFPRCWKKTIFEHVRNHSVRALFAGKKMQGSREGRWPPYRMPPKRPITPQHTISTALLSLTALLPMTQPSPPALLSLPLRPAVRTPPNVSFPRYFSPAWPLFRLGRSSNASPHPMPLTHRCIPSAWHLSHPVPLPSGTLSFWLLNSAADFAPPPSLVAVSRGSRRNWHICRHRGGYIINITPLRGLSVTITAARSSAARICVVRLKTADMPEVSPSIPMSREVNRSCSVPLVSLTAIQPLLRYS